MYSFLGISQIRLTIDVQTTSEMLSQHPVPVRHALFGIVSNVSLTMAERRSAIQGRGLLQHIVLFIGAFPSMSLYSKDQSKNEINTK